MHKNKRILFTNIRSLKIEREVPLEEAKKLGFDVVLMAVNKIHEVDHLISDYIFVEDPFDHEDCLQKVNEYHQVNALSGVFTWTDRDVELVSKIGNLLKLKTLSIRSAHLVRNKYAMRKALSTVEGLCPLYFSVFNLDDLKFAMHRINGKAIFKPIGASGSTAIIKLDQSSNLEDAYHHMLEITNPARTPMCRFYKNEYICEEYIEGQEISVDGYVDNGNIHIFGITDKDVTPDHSIEYNSFFPSNLSKNIVNLIKEKTKCALRALELDNAPFHLEARYDKNKGFMVLECAGRSGGGFIVSHLIPYATGHSCIKEILKMGTNQLSQWLGDDENVICHAGMWDNLPIKNGMIKSVRGVDEALQVEGIKHAIVWQTVGERTIVPPHSFSCIESTVIGIAENNLKLKQIIEKARKKIVIDVE